MKALVAAIVIVLLSVGVARAQDAPPTLPGETVQRLLAEATKLYVDDADYAAARAKFQAAYDLAPSWKALNGVALCHRALGDYVAAFHAFKRVIAEFGAELDAKQAAKAKKLMAEVRTKIGALVIEASQKGARVSVNGVDIGTAPLTRTILVRPGRQVVDAKLTGHVPFIARVTVQANREHKVEVELRRERERLVVKVEERPMKRRMKRWIPWAVLGGGGGLIAVGSLFMLAARSDLDEFDDQVAAMAGQFPSSVAADTELLDRGERRRGIAQLLWIGGGAAVVSGVVLLMLNQPRAVRANASASIGPRGAVVTLRF